MQETRHVSLPPLTFKHFLTINVSNWKMYDSLSLGTSFYTEEFEGRIRKDNITGFNEFLVRLHHRYKPVDSKKFVFFFFTS